MEKRYYNAETLWSEVVEFETRHGALSDEHVAYRYGLASTSPYALQEPCGFDSHVWASIYAEYRRLAQHDASAQPR